MIRAEAGRIAPLVAREDGGFEVQFAKLLLCKIFAPFAYSRRAQRQLRIREQGRLHTLTALAKSARIVASTSAPPPLNSLRRVAQFHGRNQPDPARQVVKDRFGELWARIVDVWSPVLPAKMSVLRRRSIPHQPGLVAILWQANCLDANPMLRESAPGQFALPSENKKD
jgi:hypothetical protein